MCCRLALSHTHHQGQEMKSECGLSRSAQYAGPGAFCSVFEHNMAAFYQLAFLLTADHELAQRMFIGGLDDCLKSEFVFEEWAPAWARRAIICNAIAALAPAF